MGAFTTVGLETITKEMSALWIPLLLQTYDELDYVRGKIDPRLEKALGAKGFVVLNWGDAGWVKYFAKKPIPSLKALQQLKLWVWSGSFESEEMYKDAGFKIEPASPLDILLDLQRNKIKAFPAPATLAGTLLARGGTPGRLVRVFRALAGWLPGGTAVATVLVCAFFTTFTGASGVTILALGSLLLPVLMKDRCPLSCSSACSAASHPR